MAGLRRQVRTQIRREVSDLAEDGISVLLPDLDQFVGQHTQVVDGMVRSATQAQSQRVLDRILELDADGADIPKIKREVRKMTSKRSQWGQQLAIAAVTASMEEARSRLYELADVSMTKTWNAEGDERTRQAHREVDETSVNVGAQFLVGGFPMYAPGDPRAPIHLVANCRCWLTYQEEA